MQAALPWRVPVCVPGGVHSPSSIVTGQGARPSGPGVSNPVRRQRAFEELRERINHCQALGIRLKACGTKAFFV